MSVHAADGDALWAGSKATIAEPHGPGIASTIAGRLREHRPMSVFFTVTLAGYALLAGAIIGLGLLVTKVLLRVGAIEDADAFVPRWMAEHRRPWLNDVSGVVSKMGDIPTLPALVLVTIVVALVVRRFRIGGFLLTASLMEVTLYRLGVLAVPRVRPDVARLDTLPVDESFPSGHVAASLVVYVGLALLITSRFRRGWVGPVTWTIAVAIVLAVATSRIYRGMHHPLDALSGMLLGAGCLVVALVAVRALGHVQRLRGESALRSARPKELT